jgi:hypothetical protein
MTNETESKYLDDTDDRSGKSLQAYGDASIIRDLTAGVPKELTDLLKELDEKCSDPSVV